LVWPGARNGGGGESLSSEIFDGKITGGWRTMVFLRFNA
jgi:hypothetical protein